MTSLPPATLDEFIKLTTDAKGIYWEMLITPEQFDTTAYEWADVLAYVKAEGKRLPEPYKSDFAKCKDIEVSADSDGKRWIVNY